MTACVECSQAYERIYSSCPHCGHRKEPAARTAPAYVDGDLFELTQEVLAKMRGEAAAVVNTSFIPIPAGVDGYVAQGIRNRHMATAAAQGRLRDTLALWAGWLRSHHGRNDSQIYRTLYVTYGIDMASAQTLGATEAEELRAKLQAKLDKEGVVAA